MHLLSSQYLYNKQNMPNPELIKRQSFFLTGTFFCIVLLQLMTANLVICSQIFGITPKSLSKVMGCYGNEPIYCGAQKDWLLLFYNSNNTRQQETFQNLLRGFNKQLIYTKQTHSQNAFSYPSTAVIDCFSSASLCKYVGISSLPLVIYKSNYLKNPISYQGYVSLPGLISFVKTHEPETSYLATWYKPEGQYFKSKDYSEKQTQEILKRVLPKLEQQINEKQYKTQQQKNNSINQEPNIYQIQRQNQERARMKQLQQEQKERLREINRERQQNQQKARIQKNQYQQKQKKQKNNMQQEQKTKKQQKQKQGKKKSSKQKKKSQSQLDFLKVVDSSSTAVTQLFASLGVGGIFLQAISWISYCFFFVIFGILCLVVN